MKKLLVTTAVCLIGVASVMAQGRIIFAPTTTTPILISNPLINGGAASVLGTASTAAFGIGPASVQVYLMAGLTSSSLSPVLVGTAANAPFVLNTSSGIAGAQGTFAGGNPLPLPGFDGSAPVFLQMHLLSVNGQYESFSSIISVLPALSPAPATLVFAVAGGPNAWNSASFAMTPVPEPTSMVLAGLGAASLLLFRRRK